MSVITALDTYDIRFPTSRDLDGSDAMNPDPDYSTAYVVVRTDAQDGLEGHGFAFTIGRGNEVVRAAIDSLAPFVLGASVEELLEEMGATWKRLVHDSQLRWLGPEKGVTHMATGALINALWDLKAKRAGLPLWQLLSTMTPEQLVELVDFRYLTDVLAEERALEILREKVPGRAERLERLLAQGYPAYTTTPGWLGYSDEKLVRLTQEAVHEGFNQIKLKVGADLDQDLHRLSLAREAVGPNIRIAVDANQRWDVPEAIEWIQAMTPFDLAWVEEPTSPDDILGQSTIAQAVHPVRIASGEHVANRVMFKQLLQAGALQVLQIDATRVAGVNENIAILLLAAAFNVPVCPHAGGVGLCEAVQHLSMLDFIAVSGSADERMIEYVDHLHQHFLDPVVVRDGRYWPPRAPGASTQLSARTLQDYLYPSGPVWREVSAVHVSELTSEVQGEGAAPVAAAGAAEHE